MFLSNNTQVRPLGSVVTDGTGRAGRRQTLDLTKNVKTIELDVTVTGDVVIAGAAASAVVDTGSILSVYDECGINDGADRLPSNPLDNRFLTEAFSQKPVGATRLSALTVGTHSLKERFTIFGSFPFAAMREEISLMERSLDGTYVFYIKQTNAADGGGSRIATAGGGGTVVVQNVVVSVRQKFVAIGGRLPVFQPRWEADLIPVPSSQTALQKSLMKQYYTQGILVRQDVSGGPRVGDILSALKLTATNRTLVGDEAISTDDLQAMIDRELAGSVYTLGGTNPYVLLWFQRGGRLGKILRPNDPNLKATLSVAPSATAGSSELQLTYFLLERDNTVRRDGSRITMTDADVKASGLKI